MTATYVNAGVAAHADNASVTPALPAGIAVGDLLVVFAGSRSTARTVTAPAEWTLVADAASHVRVYAAVYDGIITAPLMSVTAGAAGDTMSAQVMALRGVALSVNGVATLTNASAQNIAVPALVPTRHGCVVVAAGWKQDDWTSVATIATMTEIAEASTLTGSDQGLVWDYLIQTTAASFGATSFVVTGGIAAVSKGITLAFNAAPALTVTTQDVYPPRTLITVTGLTIGDSITLYRSISGVRTAIRGGSDTSVADTAFVRVDAELPYGVPVSYVAVVNDMEVTSTATSYTLPGGKVVISDAITGVSAEVVILAWPEKLIERVHTRFAVGGRNVVVSGDWGQASGLIELYVETTSSRDGIAALLATATSGVIQIRQPGGYDGVDSYQAVVGSRERRWSQDGSDERRVITLDAVEVEGWPPALENAGYTLQDIADAYVGQTLLDLSGDYATLLLLAQEDWS